MCAASPIAKALSLIYSLDHYAYGHTSTNRALKFPHPNPHDLQFPRLRSSSYPSKSTEIMPPKRSQLTGTGPKGRTTAPKSLAQTVYHGLTSSENRSVIQSVVIFGVSPFPVSKEDDGLCRREWCGWLRNDGGRNCSTALVVILDLEVKKSRLTNFSVIGRCGILLQ